MAAKKTPTKRPSSKKTLASPGWETKFAPVGVIGVVEHLPTRSSISSDIMDAVVAANGGYVELDLGGRTAQSVKSTVTKAFTDAGLKVTVTSSQGRVFVSLVS